MVLRLCQLLIGLCILAVLYTAEAMAVAEAAFTVKVVDEEGVPIPAARVGVGFTIHETWSSREIPVVGFTDGTGSFTASATADGDVGFNVTKDGYYRSTGNYKFNDLSGTHWNGPLEFLVVLRKKEKPVAMYLRDTKFPKPLTVPRLDEELGFDLIEYDWVPPFGKGKTADLLIKSERNYRNDRDFDVSLTITFPNVFDGIQLHREDRKSGSDFKLPRLAPMEGYDSKLVVRKTMTPKNGVTKSGDDLTNYFFRVRSEEKDGKLVRGMYGKIHGGIEIDPRGNSTLSVTMKYFLNPSYTTNMEFGKNINTGLNINTN